MTNHEYYKSLGLLHIKEHIKDFDVHQLDIIYANLNADFFSIGDVSVRYHALRKEVYTLVVSRLQGLIQRRGDK